MKYAIVTPTFRDHFIYIEKYLQSFDKYVCDKQKIELLFTVGANEKEALQQIVSKYQSRICCKIFEFEKILKHFGVDLTPEDLLRKYQKFTFQTLKKFYTMLYSDADYFLILDSESMWIRPTSMEEVFEQFLRRPFISGSSVDKRSVVSSFTKSVCKNVNYLLNQDCDKWFLENFVWFYDKKILQDLFQQMGSPFEMANKIYDLSDLDRRESGIFEIQLYQAFLYHYRKKYRYHFEDVDKLLESICPKRILSQYLTEHQRLFVGNCGLLERAMTLLNQENINSLIHIFQEAHFNIIRCDDTNSQNYQLQQTFLRKVCPNILAASQGHVFGVNRTIAAFVRNSVPLYKLKRHFSRFISPIKMCLRWIEDLGGTLGYTVYFVITIPRLLWHGFLLTRDR